MLNVERAKQCNVQRKAIHAEQHGNTWFECDMGKALWKASSSLKLRSTSLAKRVGLGGAGDSKQMGSS